MGSPALLAPVPQIWKRPHPSVLSEEWEICPGASSKALPSRTAALASHLCQGLVRASGFGGVLAKWTVACNASRVLHRGSALQWGQAGSTLSHKVPAPGTFRTFPGSWFCQDCNSPAGSWG